jgi:predicted RNA-binding protein with PIN domain
MALVRILVDGYSLLHNWPELAPGRPRHSAAARDELIAELTRYQDASGTPITIFFDGSGKVRQVGKDEFARPVEVLYSGGGQTADDLIERAAYRFKDFGEVLVVTDDFAERDTVISMGGLATSCDNFLRTMGGAFKELNDDVKHHNRKERNQFNRPVIK